MSSDDFVVPRFLRTPSPDEVLLDEVLLDEVVDDSALIDRTLVDGASPAAFDDPGAQSSDSLPSRLFDRTVATRRSQSSVIERDLSTRSDSDSPTVDSPTVDSPTADSATADSPTVDSLPTAIAATHSAPDGFTFVDPSNPAVDALFERFRVIAVRDPLDVLIADAIEAKIYASPGLSLTASVSPPVASVREYGLNPTGIDIEWDSVRPLIAQLWNELVIFEYFHGSRFEAWLDIDGRFLLVTLLIDDYTTLWKFTDAFRAVVEAASEI